MGGEDGLLVSREDGYQVCDDPSRLDLDRVHKWLSEDAYWSLGRDRATVERSIAHSVCFGAYRPDGTQVAFARTVTDRATFAWLCDVYVDPAERGRGVGTWLVDTVREQLLGMGVDRIVLVTRDAHGVYARLGFTPLVAPGRWMELDTRAVDADGDGDRA